MRCARRVGAGAVSTGCLRRGSPTGAGDVASRPSPRCFVPGAAVIHSHEYSLGEWVRRSFDETRAMRDVYGWAAGPRTLARNFRGKVMADWRWFRSANDVSRPRRRADPSPGKIRRTSRRALCRGSARSSRRSTPTFCRRPALARRPLLNGGKARPPTAGPASRSRLLGYPLAMPAPANAGGSCRWCSRSVSKSFTVPEEQFTPSRSAPSILGVGSVGDASRR